MINQQLDRMITKALEDGVLTDKEREILMRKAELLGVDADEFELELESRLGVPNTNTPTPNNAPLKEGVVKCPACGSLRKAMQTQCSDCGYEFTEVRSNSSIQKLIQMLDEIESQRKDVSSNPFLSLGQIMGQELLGGGIDKKKQDVIRNFPIPNTKEDILEFLSLALPNARQRGNFITRIFDENKIHNELALAWKTKCEQIVIKARFSMKEDKATLAEINEYAQHLGIK